MQKLPRTIRRATAVSALTVTALMAAAPAMAATQTSAAARGGCEVSGGMQLAQNILMGCPPETKQSGGLFSGLMGG